MAPQFCGMGVSIRMNDTQTHKTVIATVRLPHTRRVSVRNVSAFFRYASLRLRYRNMRGAMFFLDAGSDVLVGLDADVHIGRGVRMMRDFTGRFIGKLTIGDNVLFSRGYTVGAHSHVIIGNGTLFGEGVSIHDQNHVTTRTDIDIEHQGFEIEPIVIGNNVWVGAKATILQGVRIGDHAVIGANAVVTHDVPAFAVAVGIPARVVRILTPTP